jgi:hypothetical protein
LDLDALFRGSYINWRVVEESWAKKTVSSRLMLFAAREYVAAVPDTVPDPERLELFDTLHRDAARAFASPPASATSPAAGPWGAFIDRALAAELEMMPYGERPPTLYEIRAGLTQAAEEAGAGTALEEWFLDRVENLPGFDLPDDPGYIPI